MHGRTLLLAVCLLTVPLLGCLGNFDDPEPNADTEGPDVTPGPSTVDVYRAGSVDEAPERVDPGEALPDGVSLPAGLDRFLDEPTFEPTIGVTSSGNLFVSNLAGDTGTGFSSIVRSMDQGQTWEDVTGELGPLSSPPQSNDPYVYVDEATDRVYNLDMQGLQGNYIRWSDDEGETWTARPQAGETPVLDHPTLWASEPREVTTTQYENVVHLCVNRVGDSACSMSLDGGLTWTPFATVFPGTNTDGEVCGGLHAHGTDAPDGTIYLPKGQCGTPMVAISEDDGLTWETVTISEDVPAPGHEVAFAVDEASNAYAFWMSTDRQPYLAVSTDAGESWEEPMRVGPPDVQIARFPTVAAGDEGRVAVAYIGTASTDPQGSMEGDDTWNAYLTTSADATSEDPLFTTVTANDPEDPIARGPCQDRCTPPEGGALGDFIDVVIDEDGRPWAAYVDACTQECATSAEDPVEEKRQSNDAGVGFVGTLSQGPALRGPVDGLPPLEGAS